MKKSITVCALGILLSASCLFSGVSLCYAQKKEITLQRIGSYRTGIFAGSAAEIPAYDAKSKRIFVTNAATGNIDVLDIMDPENPILVNSINLSDFGKAANSVAAQKGIIAAAVENNDKQAPGTVAFFDANGSFLNKVTVGALPDMLTFTPNGRHLLVANEGEPDDSYQNDPEGTVSIIDLCIDNDSYPGRHLKTERKRHESLAECVTHLTQDQVRTVSFTRFNGTALDESIRVFGPNATVAQDLEPEYITVSRDSKTAWVSLQENNALAEIDIDEGAVKQLVGLGFKDHSLPNNGLDASNKDDIINITNWPVYGMYQPDAIASYFYRGKTFIVTANEGDSRDYDAFSEEARIKDISLDPYTFPNAEELQQSENVGRLKITNTKGDIDDDGDFDRLYSYGARSFSIFNDKGEMVFDSGDAIEKITADSLPADFNSTDDENDSFDNRSDDKGPEPEGIALGHIGRRTYAFIGLERVGGIMVYDITNPYAPQFIEYKNTRDFGGDPSLDTAGDLAPEGLLFISRDRSPVHKPLLVVANEVSGSTTIFEIKEAKGDCQED
ncbi:MAG: choice-of-anchor I family protein [Desulfobulbaceae bacterium]|nr:choice-of-anchor I family protein [Desulfobulbaceae bacterium]